MNHVHVIYIAGCISQYAAEQSWAAQYSTGLLINLTPKGVVFSLLSSLQLSEAYGSLRAAIHVTCDAAMLGMSAL